jgi:uncharacterized protein (DUF2147 family)
MKRGFPEPLTPQLQAELDTLAAMPESQIDTADMPPIAAWSHAVRGPGVPEPPHSPNIPYKGEVILRTIRHKCLCVFTLALFALVSVATDRAQQLSPKLQNAVGHWQIVGSDGKPGGQAETYLVNGNLFGRVTQVRPGRSERDVCDKCSGELKNQPILKMVFMRNFHPDGDDWVDGSVVDPENGKEYKGKIWVVGRDELHLRGFIGISLFGRTETWVRMH